MSNCSDHAPITTAGSRYGHCGACHRDFMGLAAFDKHRRGPYTDRRCVDPASDAETTASGNPVAQWWIDDKGRWHEGQRGWRDQGEDE